MLQTVLKYMPLKATMREVEIPGLSSGDIAFHGVVSSQEYQSIIVNAKVFSYCCFILYHRCEKRILQNVKNAKNVTRIFKNGKKNVTSMYYT